ARAPSVGDSLLRAGRRPAQGGTVERPAPLRRHRALPPGAGAAGARHRLQPRRDQAPLLRLPGDDADLAALADAGREEARRAGLAGAAHRIDADGAAPAATLLPLPGRRAVRPRDARGAPRLVIAAEISNDLQR